MIFQKKGEKDCVYYGRNNAKHSLLLHTDMRSYNISKLVLSTFIVALLLILSCVSFKVSVLILQHFIRAMSHSFYLKGTSIPLGKSRIPPG